jgi:hypothetical protein
LVINKYNGRLGNIGLLQIYMEFDARAHEGYALTKSNFED